MRSVTFYITTLFEKGCKLASLAISRKMPGLILQNAYQGIWGLCRCYCRKFSCFVVLHSHFQHYLCLILLSLQASLILHSRSFGTIYPLPELDFGFSTAATDQQSAIMLDAWICFILHLLYLWGDYPGMFFLEYPFAHNSLQAGNVEGVPAQFCTPLGWWCRVYFLQNGYQISFQPPKLPFSQHYLCLMLS